MRNQQVYRAFCQELEALLQEATVFEQAGYTVPELPEYCMQQDSPPTGAAEALSATDVTLLGAAALGAAKGLQVAS